MQIELISKSLGVNHYSQLNNEEIIAAVARHGKIKEDNGKLVKYLMDNAHWSPLQHIFFGFKVQTSRAISAQIFRHRSLHFQETSQRYEAIQSFEDIELRKQHEKNRQSSTDTFDPIVLIESNNMPASEAINIALDFVNTVYNGLLEAGVAKECARFILPMCSTTHIHISGSLRDLLAFLNVRCDKHAQKEVRDIATEMGEILEQELPNVMKVIDWRNGMFM